MDNSIYHSALIYNRLRQSGLCQLFSRVVIKHILAIMTAAFTHGYRGKTTNFGDCSPCHRTTVAHFLNQGRWDDAKLEDILKGSVVRAVYGEAFRFGKPVFCIVDDTIASKTKPSSRALHPIEDAYSHQSHLKRRQDYGHQAVSVMLSCNGLVLNYAVIMYDKTRSRSYRRSQESCHNRQSLPFSYAIAGTLLQMSSMHLPRAAFLSSVR